MRQADQREPGRYRPPVGRPVSLARQVSIVAASAEGFMARPRTNARQLASLLDAAPQPVYALDDRLAIVFANRACLQWVGYSAEELLGCRCRYHSSPEVTGADAAAAGLCPPPGLAGGGHAVSIVSSRDAQGRLRRRRARFVAFGTAADENAGIWAVVEAADLGEAESVTQPEEDPSSEAVRLHELLRGLRQRLGSSHPSGRLVGESLAIRQARARIGVAATSTASVVFIGPPGSGRQYAARSVHDAAPAIERGPIVPLACSLLGADLIRSTVAALSSRRSDEAAPRRGTLLLNDAEQIPEEVQEDLAAALSARSFPLRLMATSSISLAALARQGKYREELAALLSTIEIELPPLAERRQDLPLLAQAIVEQLNAHGERQLRGFTSEALDLLDAHSWPGNLDELVDVVACAHRAAEGPEIGVGDLPGSIRAAIEAAAHPRRVEQTIVLDQFLDDVQRELIRRALTRAKGNKAKAARLLGVTRPRLYRRMVQLGLEESGSG